jgi:hypothetical protein
MATQSNPHHLILGETKDFLTGKVIPDTYDEQYRQKIAKLLVNNCEFKKDKISNNVLFQINISNQKAILKIDFLVYFRKKTIMLIKFAPGSLITRRLSTVALSRIVEPYQIPIVVVTNGKDAEIINGRSGKVESSGLDHLPAKSKIINRFDAFDFKPIETNVIEKASRIVYACEVDGACPCDTDICRLE